MEDAAQLVDRAPQQTAGGISLSVEVEAETLYEAAGLALERLTKKDG